MKRLFANLFRRQLPSAAPSRRLLPPDPELRVEFGFPPKIEDFFGAVDPTGTTHDPGWDYRLWVDESAEHYLGTEQFDSLHQRFASTPGVDAVVHMDREVFLLRSKLDAAQLRELLWPHFVEAAKAGAAE